MFSVIFFSFCLLWLKARTQPYLASIISLMSKTCSYKSLENPLNTQESLPFRTIDFFFVINMMLQSYFYTTARTIIIYESVQRLHKFLPFLSFHYWCYFQNAISFWILVCQNLKLLWWSFHKKTSKVLSTITCRMSSTSPLWK